MKKIWRGALLTLGLFSLAATAVDLKLIEQQLTGGGVEGWIHGASPDQGLYVFTYRAPDNFFDHIEMSLVARDPALQRQLATLSRHDRVRVTGHFLPNPSPQKHIAVASLEVVKAYESPVEHAPYEHRAKLPDDLLNKTSALFLVHAIAGDGRIMVVEYRDSICPIYVTKPELTRDLARNDLVRLAFKVQRRPREPVHLTLDAEAAEPIQVVESIRARHGQSITLTGALALFPKSPEIKFNVFALQQTLPDGLERQYTLVNFDSPETFARIRDLLQKAWDKYPGAYANARNKFVSTKIRIRATGTLNEVDPSQANPQILLSSVDSFSVLEP